MSNNIITFNINNLATLSNRNVLTDGAVVQSFRFDKVNGTSYASFPILNYIKQYGVNPASSSTIISSLKNSSINYPLDANYDAIRGLLWVTDAGNNRIIAIDKDLNIVHSINNIALPHSIIINDNNVDVFSKAYSSLTSGVIHHIVNGSVVSSFEYPSIWPITNNKPTISLNTITYPYPLSTNSEWIKLIPSYTSMTFDSFRDKLWFVDGNKVYLINLITKNFYYLKVELINMNAINVDNNSGNVFVNGEGHRGSEIWQIDRDNVEVIGKGFIPS